MGTELSAARGLRSPQKVAMSSMSGSQSGSQRAQSPGRIGRRLASVFPARRHVGRSRAISGDAAGLIWEQEAAGSNPAIPTASFECVIGSGKQA